jgi:uncharacterized membrane protein
MREIDRVALRSIGMLVVAGGATVSAVAGWESPVRVVLALLFVLFVPGLAIAELLRVQDPIHRLALATASSLAIETVVAITLLYAGFFSASHVLGVLLALTALTLGGALVRAQRPGP